MKASIVTVLVLFPCLSMSMIQRSQGVRRGGFFTVPDPGEFQTFIRGPGGIPIQIDTPDMPDVPDFSDAVLLGAALGGQGRLGPGALPYYDALFDSPRRAPRRRQRARAGLRRRGLMRRY